MACWAPPNWKKAFSGGLIRMIPKSQLDVIGKSCLTVNDCYRKCAEHYITFNQEASWRGFAESMYENGATSESLKAVKAYLPPKGICMTAWESIMVQLMTEEPNLHLSNNL